MANLTIHLTQKLHHETFVYHNLIFSKSQCPIQCKPIRNLMIQSSVNQMTRQGNLIFRI